ncbi:hypothetical protein EX895_001796 [Sporisorium graminicola]|uniref:Chalcone isomerase domain-containing protein n=1 Tax=Sporisorium graminicola TaxID=280036 RepID=A0A4U7KWX0_9BASI|nr:hypothetical protein EX895_001796 [Sporisorium graminicola]TKY89265.1 hypothetical protein EX895_001796 [Sporisorium graminicola]
MLSTHSSIALTGARRLATSHSSATTRGVATFTRSYPSFQASKPSATRTQAAFFQHSFHPSLIASLQSTPTHHTAHRRWKSFIAAAALAGLASVYSLSLGGSVKLEAAPAGAASSLTSIAADPSQQVVVDTDTNLSFPLYIPTPASFRSTDEPGPKLRLVGLGVRTVSFLRVRVYVAALYIDEAALHASDPAHAKSLEQRMKSLLDQGTPAVIRIVPVRNTDFNHLRDGFIRALQARLKLALKTARVKAGSAAEEGFTRGVQQIKESFPRGSVPKGAPLDVVVRPGKGGQPASLNFEYKGQVFGQVESGSQENEVKGGDAGFTVARELVLAYFAEQGEISTPFKKSVEQGLLSQQQ